MAHGHATSTGKAPGNRTLKQGHNKSNDVGGAKTGDHQMDQGSGHDKSGSAQMQQGDHPGGHKPTADHSLDKRAGTQSGSTNTNRQHPAGGNADL